MAPFPSSKGSRQENVDIAWRRAREVAAAVEARVAAVNSAAAAGPIAASSILDLAPFLFEAKARLQSAAAVTGIAAYAQEQIADPNFDVVASFNDMLAAITAVQSWIVANFPKDANGFLLARTFAADGSGRTQDRTFSPAQTATLRAVLASVIATID